jgi:hypothetical protein
MFMVQPCRMALICCFVRLCVQSCPTRHVRVQREQHVAVDGSYL